MNPKTINLSRMKILGILLIIAVFMAIGPRAQAFTWYTANQYTIAWDAVTEKSDGTAIPDTDTVEYSVALSNQITDPDKTNPVEVWRGPEIQTTFTIAVEGQYFIGVKAIRKIADGTDVSESVNAWSDDPGATGDNPFGVRFYLSPKLVTGIGKPPEG